MRFARLRPVFHVCLVALAILSVWQLETARGSVETRRAQFGQTPATLYVPKKAEGDLVIVSHGFGGSRQMMDAISRTIAGSGQTVIAFDYIGHGRHARPLSPEITSLDGTTEDLVRQTLDVVAQAQGLTGLERVSFVGHSMATDVIIRAALRVPTTGSVAAISMYSDAVTPTHPARLLVISGAFEGRLREVALAAVSQVGPAQEGHTVGTGGIARRAVSAPRVGHVGVLWSARTLAEVSEWLGRRTAPAPVGAWIAALLVSVTLLFRPLATRLPETDRPSLPGNLHLACAATIPAVLAGAAASTGLPLGGLAGFGALALAFAVWGLSVLLILWPGLRFSAVDLITAVLLVGWGLGIFALALDRYGAAFVPTGPRVTLAVLLLPGAVLFALADRVLVAGRGTILRLLLRLPFLIALATAMIALPTRLGLVFTVLPVMVLFFLVYGTMATWAARRTGPTGAGLGSGIILAWAIAASTPLFQG